MTREEFNYLFNTYFEDVRRYVFYKSGDEDAATDIAQDTFLRLWEKQMNIRMETAKNLLLKIANDLFITRYHKQKLAFNFFNTYVPNEKSLSPEDQLNYKDLINRYEKALRKMPEKQRMVFLLNRIDELKYKDIADQLGLSVKAVEKRMSLALEYLKEQLKDQIAPLILFLFGYCFSENQKNNKWTTRSKIAI